VTIHRKCATLARKTEAMADGPVSCYDEQVQVPRLKGASSFVLAGSGNSATVKCQPRSGSLFEPQSPSVRA